MKVCLVTICIGEKYLQQYTQHTHKSSIPPSVFRVQHDRAQMNANIATMIRTNHLTLFFAEHDFDDFGFALEQAQVPMALRKVVLRMDAPDRMAEHDALTAKDYEVFETDVV